MSIRAAGENLERADQHGFIIIMGRLPGAFLLLMAMLAGCATGPRYGEVSNSLRPIGNDIARITFFREAHLLGAPLSPRVKIDGQKVGELPNGSALIVEHAPGELTISIDLAVERGVLEFPFTARPGQEYYVEVGLEEPNNFNKWMGGIVTEYLSTLRAEGVTQFCSGWCAQVRDRTQALPKLSDLHVQTPEGKSAPHLATKRR